MSLVSFNDSQVNLIRDTICKGASDDEFKLFLHVCQKSGLDPMLKQIYSIKRGNTRTIQTSIDGLRLIAERTGRYSPGRESTFTHNENGRLVSATAYVKKMTPDGTWHETATTVFLNEYTQNQGLWSKMPSVMLSKCAESNALRRAFPAEMCGLYSDDEMSQADAVEVKPAAQISPVVIETLTTEQIKIIDDLLSSQELKDWFKKTVKDMGYADWEKIEQSKFKGVVKFINDKKVVK